MATSKATTPTATQPKEQAMKTQETPTQPDVKLTEITPFHFAFATKTARVDVAWKQAQSEWRISYEGATYTTTDSKAVAMETGKALVVNLGRIAWVEQPKHDHASKPIRLENGNFLLAEVHLCGDRKWRFSLVVENGNNREIDRVPGCRLVGSNGKDGYARETTALRKAELALLRGIETQGVYNPDDLPEGVTKAVASYQPESETPTETETAKQLLN